MLRDLQTIADHESFLPSNLTHFQQVISLNFYNNSKKSSLIKIQAYVLVVKIDLVRLTHNCFLRVENHAFVKVELADFCCVVSRKNFQRDSVFVYFSTLWLKNFTIDWFDEKNLLGIAVNFSFFHTAQCGNYRNLLSHFLEKQFVKATFLLK